MLESGARATLEDVITRKPSDRFATIAIGASAGGIEALHVVVEGLPSDLDVAVLIVQHLDRRHDSILAALLGRHAVLPVKQAMHGEAILAGTVYVGPPDRHLLATRGRIELSESKLVHFTRPAVDRLFECVAREYDRHAIGVILTGSGTDGATGIRAIKGMGGATVVQDPSTARHASMPKAACATGCVDRVVPLHSIAGVLVEMLAAGVRDGGYEPRV